MYQTCKALLLTAAAAGLTTAPAAFGLTAPYEQAHAHYEIGHYEQAFAAFADLADEGHCGAARIALQMARFGRALYAVEIKATPDRLERWQRLPACPAGAFARRAAPRP